MQRKWKKAGIGLVLAALLVVSAPVALFAAEDTVAVSPGLGLGRMYGSMITVISDLLGMTPDAVRAARWEGKSIIDIAKEKDITEEKLIETITSTRKANLQDAVQKGVITQEQADLCLEQMNERIKANLERTTVGPPQWAQGRRQGMGPGRGFGRGIGGRFGWQAGTSQ